MRNLHTQYNSLDYTLMNKISTIFIGTSYEGVSSLDELAASPDFSVSAVLTQPDKPAGRKQKLTPSPIKQAALSHTIPIHTTSEEDIYRKILKEYAPELAVTIAFGDFIPGFFLEALTYTCINVHYSLLPQLRGAVPVQMAILQDLPETGVTIQIMEEKMDTGPILAQARVPISSDETTPSLKEKLIPTGEKLLMDTLPRWIDGSITPNQQDDSHATYCYMSDISKENARIVWDRMDAAHIERMVRAFLPWPVAWTTLPDGKRLKIFKASVVPVKSAEPPGQYIKETKSLIFAAKDRERGLEVHEGQIEGKRKMTGSEIRNGLKG
jgi:methionyl-tRNA formyltransferase